MNTARTETRNQRLLEQLRKELDTAEYNENTARNVFSEAVMRRLEVETRLRSILRKNTGQLEA